MKKILFVFGTRPEAIKIAPVIQEFKKYNDKFVVKVCVTAQHRELLDQVLDLFEIVPDFDLNLMSESQTLTTLTCKILQNVSMVLDEFVPDLVFVHGDTTTTFSSSLACFYKKITVAHIEAGLRTGNMYSPWPEEINRKITSCIANYHFAPTEMSKENLLNEGVNSGKIIVTGNTVIDALFNALERLENNVKLKLKLDSQFSFLDTEKKIILVTGHRRENFGDGFCQIFKALIKIIKNFDVEIVYPLHPNPMVNVPALKALGNFRNIHLIEPLGYLPFVYIMERSYLILTDSGGIQEEAPSLGKPVLLMRDTTERPEAVNAGTVKLVGTNSDVIFDEVSALINDFRLYESMSNAVNPYGTGFSSKKIVEKFLN